MQLIINNLTGSPQSYASGNVTVAANSSTTVTNTTYQLMCSYDGTLRQNLFSALATLSDSVSTYGGQDAITYLYQLAKVIGPISDLSGNGITSTTINSKQRIDTNTSADGIDGSTAPYGTLQVGGKDGSGNLQTVATDTNGNQQVVGSVASGTADSGNGVKISGVFNTTVPSIANGERSDLQTDSRGALQITPLDGARASYSAAKLGLNPQGSDVFTITGSATKTIRVTRVEISFTQSIYNDNDVQLIKRSTANTGGTSASVPAVSHDSSNAAATATVLSYTANPTLGTSVGVVRVAKLFGQATSEPYAGSQVLVWDFGERPSQAIVLRGTTQVLAVNLNTVTISGASFDISIEWTEE